MAKKIKNVKLISGGGINANGGYNAGCYEIEFEERGVWAMVAEAVAYVRSLLRR